MSESNQNRRDFLKMAGLSVVVAGLAEQLIPSKASAADAGPVNPKDPMAVQLGYTEDAAKVDTKKWPKRAGAGGAKQFCYDCMFFQASGDPKAAKTAPCQIFAGKTVKAKAWCNSWTQNPKVQA